MPDYNLAGLSARSFEQMIQALACKVIGPGIVIFGDGPDGGREATFTGRLSNFPSSTACWDGYLVVQAKFCHRPKGKPKEDARWAAQQLKKELDAFVAPKSKRRRPQYYIFATNVVLSPVQIRGGKDSIAALIDQYKKKVDLKDYRIWDYDQICRLLEGDESVRHAYEAWITPGDVLAKLFLRLHAASSDFGKVMVNFLQKEILDDHFSKLEQAGHSPENRVPLEQVFVDLPAFDERRSNPPDESKFQPDLPPGFLAEMLVAGSLCLRPEELATIVGKPGAVVPTVQPERGRFVLVGGPGLGKSTLAQFLCQIHRASLLKDGKGLYSEAKQAVKSILDNCTSQELPWEMAKRFPVRVELARFAKALASQTETKVTSILSYAAFVIKDRTDFEISVDDLRRWLEKYPWLVVLDGLDEVPASSNRIQVLTAVRDFLVDISSCNADVLVLATTRPQGYHEEFSPQRYHHHWLGPLSIPRALHYAQTLVELTYAQNLQRKKEVLARLQNAAKVPATARLMESPLQVTIMARLLAQVAQPPQERYRLFEQYYEVIYRREMERGVEKLSQLLRDHEANIDAIHHRTGLLLQMESERTRHTDATISIEDFKTIVNGRLREEGYSGEGLSALTNLIATCATDRLVFLVPSLSERVGFEIRSLQEFMAAEALMDGADNVVVDRLRTIAPVPFWQNVLLFAAGKCFAERQWLRDSIAQVCSELNDDPGDKLAHLTMAGSRVAISLLEDGPARRQPAYAQALARRALTLLSLPAEDVHDRLADVYERAFETVYREELAKCLSQKDFSNRIACWRVICRLISQKGIAWVQEMAESQWPTAITDTVELLRNLDLLNLNLTRNRWLTDKYLEVFFKVPILSSVLYISSREKGYRQLFSGNKLAVRILDLLQMRIARRKLLFVSLETERTEPLRLSFVPINVSQKFLCHFVSLGDVHAYWKPLVEGARFAKEPSNNSLAYALRSIAASFEAQYPQRYARYWRYGFALPWPLSACLESAETSEDFLVFADRAERGDMGNFTDWLEAEQRWKLRGVTLEDVQHMTDDHWPIPRDIRTIGFPLASASLEVGLEHEDRYTFALREYWTNLLGEKAKSALVSDFVFYFYQGPWRLKRFELPVTTPLTVSFADTITRIHRPFFVDAEFLKSLYLDLKDTDRVGTLFSNLGHLKVRYYEDRAVPETKSILSNLGSDLCDWVDREPNLTGILNLLSEIASSFSLERVPNLIWKVVGETDSRESRSALTLQLAQRKLDGNIFTNIAEKILSRCGADESWVLSALRIFENHQMGNNAGVVFLEKMIAGLPTSFCRAREKVVTLLLDTLGRRVASLCERTVWEKLCLPDGLPKLISE